MLYLPSRVKKKNQQQPHTQSSHNYSVPQAYGLPKYEPPASIMQKDEYVTSIPMITSKNDNEYDYVLVIRDNMLSTRDLGIRSRERKKDYEENINYVREILRRLDHAKLIINPEKHRLGDLYLIKIRADDDLLEEWAEKMHLLMRLDGSGVYAPFQRSLKSQFQITTFFPDSVFRSSERQLIIHEILHRKTWENGVELNEKILPGIVYMYPLHINNRKNELYWKWNHGYNEWEKVITTDSSSKKQLLLNYLTIISTFLWPTQPLNDMVEYFGEEVGFYFAFVESFIKWLYIPTIMGSLIFFIQLKQYHADSERQCNSLPNHANDNPLSFNIQTCEAWLPYYSLFMTIWTTAFIQFWKRRQIKLAHQWGVLNYEQKDHKTRLSYKSYAANYDGEVDEDNLNVIDENAIKSILKMLKMRACKVIVTTPVIFLLVLSCIVFMFWFLSMRASIKEKSGNVFVSYVLHTLLWGLIVPLLSGLHIKICQYLNKWENWRTESDHYKHETAKVCSLLLINTFVAMYYLCCFEQSLPAVAFQVASFMVARLFLDILVSIVIMPNLRKYKIKQVIQKNKKFQYDPSSIHNPMEMEKEDLGDDDKHSVISNNDKNAKVIDMTGDYVGIKQSAAWQQALSPKYDSFKNYCFLILFFGYVSNFSTAFCCAPVIALIGMLFKIRSDRFHLCCNTQRPLPRRVSGIGIWLTVLDQMCTAAVITNTLIIYFTTDNVFQLYWRNSNHDEYQLTMIIIFEHLLLIIRFGLKWIIPEIPLPVKAEIRLHQLTRVSRRKKLLEKAHSQQKRSSKNQKYNRKVGVRDNNLLRQSSIRSVKSNMSVLSNPSRHHTSNIHIDEFVHAFY